MSSILQYQGFHLHIFLKCTIAASRRESVKVLPVDDEVCLSLKPINAKGL